MKGIYITVPDNEFNFYMSVLERFKTATIVKTDEITSTDIGVTLHPWQIEAIEQILKEESTNPQPSINSKPFLNQLRKELDV